jgi:hypothetical protein
MEKNKSVLASTLLFLHHYLCVVRILTMNDPTQMIILGAREDFGDLEEEEQTPQCPSSDLELVSEEETCVEVAEELEKQQETQTQEKKKKRRDELVRCMKKGRLLL